MANMRVLVTGVDGYIGAVLGSRLLEHGFDVVGVDCGFYRDGWLYNDLQSRPLTLSKDIRRLKRADVEGFDAVVHLAELSNDPLGELSERVTYDINHHASVRLARLARTHQVIVVTHLPQVAAYADVHLVVHSAGPKGTSVVQRVADDDRVAELARMLAGLGESDSGRAHARELLEAAQNDDI